ncbi:MAG: transcriptional initiation protein Tat [Pseudomonadales bacterium]|nr:transcriptional initiation protein Tat [Pseudomonadales bacterium]
MEMSRRDLLGLMTSAAIAGATTSTSALASTSPATPADLITDQGLLKKLITALKATPRRRLFTSVDMVLNHPSQWDQDALKLLMNYAAPYKQVWDATDLHGPWLNLMRNSLNTQVFGFGHTDFLVLAGTHGTAHLALYDPYIWDKYHLNQLAGPDFKNNTLMNIPTALSADPHDLQNTAGVFSAQDNSIPTLQARGVVFLACHNAIFELSSKLHAQGNNPNQLSLPQLAAELTNHLIPDAVLTPGIVGTLPELQLAGFMYAK